MLIRIPAAKGKRKAFHNSHRTGPVMHGCSALWRLALEHRLKTEYGLKHAVYAAISVLHRRNGLLLAMVLSKPNKTLHIVVRA